MMIKIYSMAITRIKLLIGMKELSNSINTNNHTLLTSFNFANNQKRTTPDLLAPHQEVVFQLGHWDLEIPPFLIPLLLPLGLSEAQLPCLHPLTSPPLPPPHLVGLLQLGLRKQPEMYFFIDMNG